jgi:ryanodine receptor 2
VEQLAENTHNVWSKERIKQGWTYGLTEDFMNKRSHHLVPYSKVDEVIKKSNKQTATETVRTLIAYGYNIEAPTLEAVETFTKDLSGKSNLMRTYRAELIYGVDSGKWYYEFEVITPGYMKVGWAMVSTDPAKELGLDGCSYVFDGFVGRKWHQGSEAYGKVWQKGDVIGCMLDITDKTISFSLNGELMMDRMGQEIAFKGIDLGEPYVPAFSLSAGQHARVNFGQDVHQFKFFTCCGLQEGYEPFCVNMTRQMPLWYVKEQAVFESLNRDHPRIEVVRVPGGSTSPPCLKIHSKTFGTLERVCLEYLRLTLPVRFQEQFVAPREKQLTLERRINADNLQQQQQRQLMQQQQQQQARRVIRRDEVPEKRVGLFKKKPTKPQRALDDSSVEAMQKHGGATALPLRRQASDTNLASDFTADQHTTTAKKFSNMSKVISDMQQQVAAGGSKRAKSPFSIFKRPKSRDPSPVRAGDMQPNDALPVRITASSSEYSEESDLESLGPGINISHMTGGGVGGGAGSRLVKKRVSQTSYMSDMMELESDFRELEMNMDIIDEYYYGVRIFPGQDPSQVYVGWVTPHFHMYNSTFDMKKIRNVVVCSLDMDNQIKSSISRKNCYIVSAGDLQNRYSCQEESGKRLTPGLLIGCHVDTSTGLLSFTVNGQEAANKFQVEPGAMLFPAVFFEPTNKEVLQVELGRTKSALPLSSILFRGGKHIQPQCPPRLDLQIIKPYQWSRAPMIPNMVHVLKLSDIRGWSMLCEDAVQMMALHIPEENRCLDILELIEHHELLRFHAHTLELYRAVCSHGNHRAAHELTNYVNEGQLMFCIKNKYMPGPLRMQLHNLLISLHLDAHANSKLMTQKEFIIPLAFDTNSFSLFNKSLTTYNKSVIREGIPSLEQSVSIRPNVAIDRLKINEPTHMSSPFFPLDILKQLMMENLIEAVQKGAAYIRDPIGGSNENLFVPLLRVTDKLLVMGLLTDKDLNQLLSLIDPTNFDDGYTAVGQQQPEDELTGSSVNNEQAEVTSKKYGLIQIKLSEPVKLELCILLQHLCDIQLRHRIEAIVAFSEGFVGECQAEQRRRYIDIKQSDLPMAVAAKRTREFRCPPQEQMRTLLSFTKQNLEDPTNQNLSPIGEDLQEKLNSFHMELLRHCNHPPPAEDDEKVLEAAKIAESQQMSWTDKLLALICSKQDEKPKGPQDDGPENVQKLIISTIISWAKSDFVADQNLIRAMFSLLHRQYNGVEELIHSLEKAYVISVNSIEDIKNLYKSLGLVRSLLMVQVGPDEEELLKQSIWYLADNRVFFQHPDLMRSLGIHETVMQLMVNTLNKAQQESAATESEMSALGSQKRTSSSLSAIPAETTSPEPPKDTTADMVVACCRFLCYFCRTGRVNQRAMFEHLGYLLDNSCMLLSRPSLRGSCPLDVAYSSLMDNNELALALRESELDKVAVYLSRCGQQSNQKLISNGYPDVGWDPVEGERFLDFFRFCVWVNGESVEENANLVVRLLIRRPECLGPALRGEGGGLLKAMRDSIVMSLQILAARDQDSRGFLRAVTEMKGDDRGDYLQQSKYDFSTLPPEDDEDYIDMGAAQLQFYSSLVDLLGRCAPEAEAIKAGRSDSLRARAILRSLVSLEDLEGALGIRFILPVGKTEQIVREDGETEIIASAGLCAGLQPQHKAAVVLFLERVYGVQDQMTFYRLLENGFLPDLRAATTLESASVGDCDMALALNRYLCNAVLPLLTNNSHFFSDADYASHLLDQTLHTAYKLSKCRSLTKNQRDVVSDFLVALTGQLRPPMMTSLLRKLVVDVPALTENTITPLRVLVNHYERCGRYYGSGGWGSHGSATEEEKRLTMMLFSGIFDSLAQRGYDPELFSKALPCLSAIGCALSPDYSLSNQDDGYYNKCVMEAGWTYNPQPAETATVKLSGDLARIVDDFAEHYHDSWALAKIEAGWTYGQVYDEDKKVHPNLHGFQSLSPADKLSYIQPVEETVKAMIAWGWTVELDPSRSISKAQIKKKMSKILKLPTGDYTPKPADIRNVTLTRALLEMAEKMAENAHDIWARKKKMELESIGGGIHPQFLTYSQLTDNEKKVDRDKAQELLRYMQTSGFRIISNEVTRTRKDATTRLNKDSGNESGQGQEKRFATSLLEKLLEYLDKAAYNMKITKPASRFSRRHSFSVASEDVKFFGKVVLPLVEKYFRAHRAYFISNPNMQQSTETATIKEKEMTASLFAKLALLLRQRLTAFGHDVQISVRCLQTLVQAIDARAIVKSSPEIVRSSLLPFFTFAADDLAQTVANLKVGRFSHVKGTITRGATSLNYVHMVLLPVLTSMFDHLGRNNFGGDLLVDEEQLCCYRILNALYSLGTRSATFVQRDSIMAELARHRSALGECVASFASTFPVAFLEPQFNKFNRSSILFGIEEDRIATHSLEAKEVMDEVALNVPTLDKIVSEIEGLAESGGKYVEAPHVIEVTLPMLCSYLPFWWSQGPDNAASQQQITTVTAKLMNNVLGNVLKLIGNNIGTPNAPWMNRIATRTQPIIVNATADMMREHFIPVAKKLREQALNMEKEEEEYHLEMRRMQHQRKDSGEVEIEIQEHYQILVRDMYAFYPLLIKYVDLHRSSWLKNPSSDAELLYLCIADVFNLGSKSHLLKKEEQNFVFANEIDNMALIMPSQDKHSGVVATMEGKSEQVKTKGKKRVPKKMEVTASLNVACLKRLLPIGLNMFGGHEQELIQQAKQKLVDRAANSVDHSEFHRDSEADIEEFLRVNFTLEEKTEGDEGHQWQKSLYKKISKQTNQNNTEMSTDFAVVRMLAMSKVLYGLHLVEHPSSDMEQQWRKAVSLQRKRAVMACFRMIPLYNISRHRAINLFLKSYKEQWLKVEPPGHDKLIEDITGSSTEEGEPEEGKTEGGPEPLSQLITAFSRSATTESTALLEADSLFISYAAIMSQSCHGQEEEEEEGEAESEEGGAGASLQEQEMEKQKLLFEQSRLCGRGAAEMVLMYISASGGQWSDMVIATIDLGISILMGGNTDVQKRMLQHLKEKKDVGFFTSLAGLMQQCCVLDLDAFERCNKAEGLGVSDGTTQAKNLQDTECTCKLFRFLQLLCEGHNLDFQNYLRTQAGNTSTVNIIICTVDYLLRLQESIMDFYWHYVSKDTIDQAGKDSFLRAISVASQVFNSISEYIQGPCAGNQLALAHSRLWDAVGGFLYIFAHMQDKLSKDPEQLELLREFMKLQKDMMIMLLSMLEGNVVNGPIGKQMVDTFFESSANFEMILKFFDIFLKMKDLSSSEAFMEFDVNKDGVISPKEFRRAMESQKIYSEEEIDYVMMCVDANQDGKVDFNEFTDRFHSPAKDIGFNVAVLLTNLSEHIPNDSRLNKFLDKAKCVLDYFQPYLGRIEIMGSAGRIERVYFEIKQSNIDQWEKPQIKESKRAFLHNIVNEEGEKGKLECFVNFCEDTIFEMQHAASISAEEQGLKMLPYTPSSRATEGTTKLGLVDSVKVGFGYVKDAIRFMLSFLSPSNIKAKYQLLRSMTLKELFIAFFRLNFHLAFMLLTFLFTVLWTFVRFVYVMMRGEYYAPPPAPPKPPEKVRSKRAAQASRSPVVDLLPPEDTGASAAVDAFGFGLSLVKKDTDTADKELHQPDSPKPVVLNGKTPSSSALDHTTESSSVAGTSPTVTADHTATDGTDTLLNGGPRVGSTSDTATGKSVLNSEASGTTDEQMAEFTAQFDESVEGEYGSSGKLGLEPPLSAGSRGMNFWNFLLGVFARNFYNFKLIALALAFAINIMLLFFKVTKETAILMEGGDGDGDDTGDVDDILNGTATEDAEGGGDEDDDGVEWISMADNVSYLAPVLRIFALLHTFTAIAMMIGYYCLKVPLVVFKREKEVSRSLEFDGMWIAEQPSDDDIKGHWDKLCISTRSFPDKYWDKFVKKKVRNKYSEQYEYEQISNLLGMDKKDGFKLRTQKQVVSMLPSIFTEVDWQYQIWKWGIIFTDNSFLYIAWYFVFSFLGNFNYFFYAAHLLDVAVCFKTLGTILQSVTHNGKQLVLTFMLTSIIVYLYTVIAFNFFRKFYIQEEEGEEPDYKCHDMLSCYIFHLYVGVRAGGGIGDEIGAPDGDPYEVYRIIFDITFFFFVIVILLAIIQGLIIDAFGELRDQLEQVKEDMESSCFICGIGKDYFDKLPHGFETHVKNEHNFANYMFFLMHLINKPDTEYTGQESYVWGLYQQRCWDFFPVGECFRKQYEDELSRV